MPLSEIILVIMALLGVAMLAAGLCRNLPIPFTVFLVIIGICLNTLTAHVGILHPLLELQQTMNEYHLVPDLVFFLFLPALVFESAFNLDARQLIKDLAPVLTLAIPALLISTCLVGLGFWLILGVDPIVSLLFGALISATDPVAVVALFKELGAPLRLTILVEGESLFNDATAIVLFHILLGLALAGSLSFGDVAFALWDFIVVFFGGILVGALVGMGLSACMRRLNAGDSALVVISLIMAYVSFIVAEHSLHVSGVMAVLTAAICLGVYGKTRISQSAALLITETWEFIVLICNSLLFLLVGLLVDIQSLGAHLQEILIAAALVIVARACAVYPLVPATTRFFDLPKVRLGDQHIMWWGGLKGGLAIAIVLSIPETLPEREFLVNVTLGVVIFSLLVNAPSIRLLIHALGIDKLTADEETELDRGLSNARRKASTVLDRFQQATLVSVEARNKIDSAMESTLHSHTQGTIGRNDVRQVHLEALRVEGDELDHLYALGLIQNYTFLDLRNTLQRDREIWANATGEEVPDTAPGMSPFMRVEKAILKRLREVNWAGGLLARYQASRVSHRLQHDIASTLMCKATIHSLEHNTTLDPENRELVADVYRRRMAQRYKRLDDIRQEFPEFYQHYEHHLFQKVALLAAQQRVHTEHHHGEIGAKAYTRIEQLLHHALDALPPLPSRIRSVSASELIKLVPLFSGLSEAALDKLAQRAQNVTFLPGDIIIGENDRGDALYIITHGKVKVFKNIEGEDKLIAELGAGAFFGETALLGDHVRTATVKTLTTTILLRLKEQDVNALAEQDPEVRIKLKTVNDARKKAQSDTTDTDQQPG